MGEKRKIISGRHAISYVSDTYIMENTGSYQDIDIEENVMKIFFILNSEWISKSFEPNFLENKLNQKIPWH